MVVNKAEEEKAVASAALRLQAALVARAVMALISLVEMETKEDNKHKVAGLMALVEEPVTLEAKVASLTLLLVAVVLVTATHNAQVNAH